MADDIVERAEVYVEDWLGGEATGHDDWHVKRVHDLAVRIAEAEDVSMDMTVVRLAALLHDVKDWKFHDEEETGADGARTWLNQQNVDSDTVDHICRIIDNISFKGLETDDSMDTVEGEIVQDADRLDALGAVGIARCFATGAALGNPIHLPGKEPNKEMTRAEYEALDSTSINHFHEKLLQLKDRMNTETGKELAVERHAYMENFLERFHNEWNGMA